MRFCTALLSLVASATAYKITFPGANDTWYAGSATNKLTWERGSTDPEHFTLILSHPNTAVIPGNNVDLIATVPGWNGSIDVPAPSGGWPVGKRFILTFVSRTTNPDTETGYAQTREFEILSGTNGAANSGGMPGSSYVPPMLAAGALLALVVLLA